MQLLDDSRFDDDDDDDDEDEDDVFMLVENGVEVVGP